MLEKIKKSLARLRLLAKSSVCHSIATSIVMDLERTKNTKKIQEHLDNAKDSLYQAAILYKKESERK